MEYQGTTALITGASSGLGEEFARQLAQRGVNLVLVARSKDKMEHLADELRTKASIKVLVIAADLARPEAVEQVLQTLGEKQQTIDLLINNAGLGTFEDFLGSPLTDALQQIDVNVRSLVALTHGLVGGMVQRRRGGVINLASNAAFQPLPGANIYAASKAFVLFFSEALAQELAKTGVMISAACPGPVATPFFADMKPAMSQKQMDQPGPVVREILGAFNRRKRVIYPGKLIHRLSSLGARMMPKNLVLRIAERTVQQLNRR